VSGYDGSSLALGGFIEACKPGEIVKDKPVLAIEVIDHLGRYHFMIFFEDRLSDHI
jgi:hypothetical protein